MINASTQALEGLLGNTYIPNEDLKTVSINDALVDVIRDELADNSYNFARITYEDWQNFLPKEARDSKTVEQASPSIKEAQTYLRALRPKTKKFKQLLHELKKKVPGLKAQDVLRIYPLETPELKVTIRLEVGNPGGGLMHMLMSFTKYKIDQEGKERIQYHTSHVPQYKEQFPGTKSLSALLENIDRLMQSSGYFEPEKDGKLAYYIPVYKQIEISKKRSILPGRYKFVIGEDGFVISVFPKEKDKKQKGDWS